MIRFSIVICDYKFMKRINCDYYMDEFDIYIYDYIENFLKIFLGYVML